MLPDAVFTGFRTGPDLSELVASMDVFVHTGADETFCQAIQEAMASGVPVVAPAAGGPLDLVEAGRTGLFYQPESVGELRAAVEVLTGNPKLRTEFGQRARGVVAGRTWPAVCDELLGHYAEVLAARGDSDRRRDVG
jgi:phosphatidylinositol alpha 1,6-mannosyltransferase